MFIKSRTCSLVWIYWFDIGEKEKRENPQKPISHFLLWCMAALLGFCIYKRKMKTFADKIEIEPFIDKKKKKKKKKMYFIKIYIDQVPSFLLTWVLYLYMIKHEVACKFNRIYYAYTVHAIDLISAYYYYWWGGGWQPSIFEVGWLVGWFDEIRLPWFWVGLRGVLLGRLIVISKACEIGNSRNFKVLQFLIKLQRGSIMVFIWNLKSK